MSATGDLIAALIAGGMEAAEAAGLVARAAVEMTGALTKKSTGAARQQRYRERNKASLNVTQERAETVTDRNESVTRYAEPEASQTVTKRNESVTSDAASLSKEDRKIEVKKREGAKATQLPADWKPSDEDWKTAYAQLGDSAKSELAKFKDHALDKGRLAKNWSAAWRNWTRRAVEYGTNRNGHAVSNHRADPAAGRATAREAHHVATMGSAALRYLQEGKSAGTGRDSPDGNCAAKGAHTHNGTENAH